MRIAFIVNRFPALSETFILRQATGLLDRGHDVEIFANALGRDPVTHGDVERYGLLKRTRYFQTYAAVPSKSLRLIKRAGLLSATLHKKLLPALRSLNPARFGRRALALEIFCLIAPFLDRGRFDIVHCQFGPLGQIGLALKEVGLFHGKLVTSFRGYDASSFVRLQAENPYRRLFCEGDLFLCVSHHIRERLQRLGCAPEKIVVHRSGIDTSQIGKYSRPVRESGSVTIATVARLVEKKGIAYGIRAVASLLPRFPQLEYKIVGDGPLREDLQKLIEAQRAEDRIQVVGWKSQEEITHLLGESDILLAPSVVASDGDEEGIPGVIMEAFAHGLPVVSTYHSGIPEVIRDGWSGFLAPERDSTALAEKLEHLIQRSDLRYRMGQNGRHFVEEEYDIDKLNDRLAKVYRQLLDGQFPTTLAGSESYAFCGGRQR